MILDEEKMKFKLTCNIEFEADDLYNAFFLLSNHFRCLYEDKDDVYLEFTGDINLDKEKNYV